MITLAEASSYFDRTEARDPDNGSLQFYCQIDPYDDSRRDAGGAYRRVMSVAPGTILPASRSISIFNQTWIIGGRQPDGLEEMHREKYVLQPAPGKVNISRLEGFLYGAVAESRWASLEWAKDTKELEVSSNLPQIYYAYLPMGTDVRVLDIIWHAGYAYRVGAEHDQASGYIRVNCERLEQVLPLTAQITRRAYSAALGAYAPGATDLVNALRVRWRTLYLYGSQGDARYQEGDYSVVLPAATPLSTSDRITLDGAQWQVLSVDTMGGASVAHVRPA